MVIIIALSNFKKPAQNIHNLLIFNIKQLLYGRVTLKYT